MKKIIFIAGTARSGSTLLDLILSNDERAMSLGEIASLFHPTRKHHFEEIEKLKKDEKWNVIISGGRKNLYPNLVKLFPEIDIFVDSSKNPFWFKYHMNSLAKSDLKVANLLIHKTPLELANSYMKRGKKTEWIHTYIKYHRKYISVISDYIAISYHDLVKDEVCLKRLCEKLKINYFEGKKEYWNKEHKNFFGSFITRGVDAKKNPEKRSRKDVKYDGIDEKYLAFASESILNHDLIPAIQKEINTNDIFLDAKEKEEVNVKFSSFYVFLLKMKYTFHQKYRFYFPKEIRVK